MSNPVQEYFASLNANPDDPEAIHGLEQALSEAEAWSDITQVVPRFARNLSDPAQRTRFLIRAAYTAQHFAHNDELCRALLAEAVENLEDPDVISAGLVAAFEPSADWRGLIATGMDIVELNPDDRVSSRIFNTVGRTYEDKVYERERAITCYQRAFKLDPRFTEPLRAARAVYAHADQWTTVAKLYQIELRVTEEPREQARLLKELGYVELERLGDRDRAAETLRQAAEIDPDLSGLAATIDDLSRDSGAHGVIISPRIMQSSTAVSTVDAPPRSAGAEPEIDREDVAEEEAAELAAAVEIEPVAADITAEPIDDAGADETDSDVAADYEDELDDDVVLGSGAEPRTQEIDEDVAESDDDASEVAASTEPDEAGADGGDVEPDESFAASAGEDAPADEAELEMEASEGEDESAGAEGAPDDEFEAEAEGSGETEDSDAEDVGAEDVGAEDSAAADEASDEAAAAASGGAAFAEEGSDGGDAGASDAPDSDEGSAAQPAELAAPVVPVVRPIAGAEDYLDALVMEASDTTEAEAALDAWSWALELGSRTGREAEELAAWVVDALRGRDAGLEAVRRLLPPLIGRTDVWSLAVESLESLDDVMDRDGVLYGARFYGCRDLDGAARHRSRAGAAAVAEGDALELATKGNWRKAHTALADAHGNGEEAELDGYFDQAFLAVAVDNDDKAQDSLRRVLRKRKTDREALFFVKFLYRADEKWGPLAEVIKAEAGVLPGGDPFRLGVAYRDLIVLYRDELKQPTNVLTAYKELVEVDPGDVQVLDEYAALLEELNRPQDLVPVLRMKADAVADDASRVAIHAEVATLLLDRFNNQPEAITSYETILGIDPDHEVALTALEDLYGKRRMWDELIAVKRRLVELAAEPAAKAARLRESADIAATRMRDTELAVQLWNAAMEFAPDDPEALEALERLYEREKDWANLADVLGRRVYAIDDPQERALALVKLGQIQSDRLDDTEAAVSTYEDLLALDPENFRAKDALKKAYIDLERWNDLEEFFRRQDAWPEYVRQLESLAGSVSDSETQVELLFRAADVWTNQLEDEARATKALERVLSIDPANYDAATRLVPVYEERGDFKRIAPLLEVVLEREDDPESRFGLQVKLARIARERQRDAEGAFSWFARALEEQPHRVEIAEELESTVAERGNWDAAEQVLGGARDRLRGEPAYVDAWVALSLRLGAIYDRELGDYDRALECFDQVLDQAPDNAVALDAKDGIFTRQENWDALLGVLDAKLSRAEDDSERIALWRRICDVHETQREDLESAILGYQEILTIDAANTDALEALHRLHRATGDYGALSEVLRALIMLRGDRGETDARRALRIELAEVCIDALDEAPAAIEVLQEVVTEAPADAGARRLLERLLAEDAERLAVARILEPLYEADEVWPKLVDVLEIQLEEVEQSSAKVELLSRIGEIQRVWLENSDLATDAYARLLRIAPDNSEARGAVEAIAEATGAWEPVTELYESLMLELDPGDEAQRALAVELGTRTATFFEEKIGDPHEAIRMHRRVMDVDPSRVETLVTLDRLHTRTEEWDELLRVIGDRLALTEEPSARRELHFKAASIWRDRLESLTEAIDEYRRVLDLYPDDRDALGALDQLYGATADSASRAEVVEHLVRLAEEDGEEQLVLKNRLARIYEDELGEVPRAMELWQSILAIRPGDAMALEGLEAQLESEDYAIAASETLEPLYVEQNEPARLARLLEIRLSHVDDPDQRKALYHRIAGIHLDELEDRGQAYRVLTRAAEEFLDEQSVINRLFTLAGVLGSYGSLGDTLERLANDHGDPKVTRDTLVRVARIREEQVGDVGAAADLWRQVLEDNPSDREALDALERLDEQTETWGELVEVLLRKAELPDVVAAPAQAKRLMFRAAVIHEEMLGQPDEAIEVLRTVQLSDPSDTDAIHQLERLYTQTERWEDLVDNYHRKLELADAAEERRDLYATLGAVLETELQDPDRAIGAFRSILDIDPNDLQALQALDRLYVATEAWYELQSILNRQVELVQTDDQRRNIQHRIGRLYETELGDFSEAVRTYAAVLQEDPAFEPSRTALQAMIERGDEALAAARVLEPIYRSEARWEELVAINRTLIDFASDPEQRRSLHVDIAAVLERELGDPAGAFAAYAAAAAEETRIAELDQLERLAGITGAWDRTCELFAELWDEAADPVVRSELGLRVARIREEQLDDVDGSIGSYVRLHEEDPTQQGPLDALDRLYSRAGQWEALADILQKRIFAGGAANDPTSLRLRLADTYREHLGDPAEAVSVYREVLVEDARNRTATSALESMIRDGVETFEIASILDPLYRQHSDWSKLVELNQMRIRNESSGDERFRIWLDTAEVLENRVGNKPDALNALGNALFEQPADVGLKDRLEALGGELDHWTVVGEVYDMLLGQDLDDADRLDVALRLARVREEKLDDVAGAESAYRAVLSVEPANAAALRSLDAILTAQGRWVEVVDVLGRLREAVFDPSEMVALAYRHACLYRDQLGEDAMAIDTFDEVLELDPAHRPSLDALVRLYQGRSDWDSLFDTYERISLVSSDERERVELTVKMATLATEQLDRPMDAVDLWQAALVARPNDREALANLAFLFERTEQFNDLVDVIDRQVELATDDEERLELLRRSGRLWAEVLDNQDQAIARYARVLEQAPDDVGSLRAVRDLYEVVGDFERLVRTLEQLLALGAVAPDEQVEVYRQLGTIQADTLMQPAPAIAAWRQVIAREPGDDDALDRLEGLHTQQEQWAEVVGIVEMKVARATDADDRIELLKRIADTQANRLGDADAAAAAYERVLELDLADFDATAALDEIYQRTERWQDLAGLCLDRLDVVEDPWERLQLLRRAAELYETRLGQPDGAFVIMGTAAQENPGDEDVRASLERLADAAGKHEDLVQTYLALATRLESEGDADSALPILVSAGRLQDDKLGALTEAELTFERVLALDPENESALDALESLLTRTESWGSLIGVLRRRVNLAFDPMQQVALHKRIGKLFEEQLGDTIEAVEAYKMVIRLDEQDREALDALERIYSANGDWRDLVDVLERKAENTFEPDALVSLHFRIGEIWQGRLGVAERAVEAFKNVLDHDPSHMPSLQALESLYAGLDKWERFVDVIEAQIGLTTEPQAQIGLQAKLAIVYEQHFDDVDAAVNALLNILAIDPKDLDAITNLERIYEDQERIPDLVDALERHVQAVADPSEKAEVLCRIGQVQVEQLDDAHAAIESYRRVLEIDGKHADALARIGALYEHVDRPDYAVQAYERLARVAESPEARLRLYFRAGQLLMAPIGDVDGAAERFRRCLEMDEGFVAAMEQLEKIHAERGEWEAVLDMIQRQIEFARGLEVRSALMVRQADVFGRHLGDKARAQLLYEEAIELDPNNVRAAEPLSAMFFEQKEWVRARPLFELQMAAKADRDETETKQLLYRSAIVAQELGFEDQAVSLFERILEFEIGHLGALRGLARLYRSLGRPDDAFQTYVDILAEHRSSMDSAEIVDCYHQAGLIKLEQGDEVGARQMFSNALEVEPEHEPSLRRLLAIVEASGEQHTVVEIKQRLLPTVGEGLERFKLLVEIGDAHLALADSGKAEESYREAVRLDPNSKVVLHKLLNIFTDTGNWRRATEVLGQLARMEEDPDRLAKLCFTIAAIFRDELGEMQQAVQFFNQALDAKFDYLEAFEAIDHLLTSARDWKALEQNYRRMLGRCENEGASAELKVTLLRNLGEIYRSRLHQVEDAIAAYTLASQLSPEDEALLTILAELLEHTGASTQDIIRQHQRLIRVSPFRIESYRALFRAFLEEKRFDEAWCLASALSLLQKASPEEEKYYTRYLPPNVREARPGINPTVWHERLYHPDLDRNVTTLFEVLAVHLRPLFKRDPKDWGVHKRKDRVDLEQPTPLSKMLGYSMNRLGVPELAVYERQEHVGLVNMNADPPALLAGGDMFAGKGQRELAFQVAKSVTLMRPEFYLASAFPATEHLKTFFFAAAAAVTGQVIGDANAQIVTQYAQEIRDLPPPVFEQVKRAVTAIFESGRNPDLSAWLRAVDHTASRVGLVICGDLRTSVSCLKIEADRGQSVSKADLKDRVRELVLFSISDNHFALRRDLGLALKPS